MRLLAAAVCGPRVCVIVCARRVQVKRRRHRRLLLLAACTQCSGKSETL